jgi:hypothetical protein
MYKTALPSNYSCINHGSQTLENGDLDEYEGKFKINIINNFLFYKSLNRSNTILHFLQRTLGTKCKTYHRIKIVH